MEIRAYDKEYLPDAQKCLGDAFDFAMVTLEMEPDRWEQLFLASDACRQFENGNPAIICGENGCELVRRILHEHGLLDPEQADAMYLDKSPEYWCGWALAWYQWYTGQPFRQILSVVPVTELLRMYPVYHEMDIRQFADAMRERIRAAAQETRLKYFRQNLGISQAELSERASVPLRQIQLFEQRQRDINKTQGETLLRLSKALYCSMEDLMEYG